MRPHKSPAANEWLAFFINLLYLNKMNKVVLVVDASTLKAKIDLPKEIKIALSKAIVKAQEVDTENAKDFIVNVTLLKTQEELTCGQLELVLGTLMEEIYKTTTGLESMPEILQEMAAVDTEGILAVLYQAILVNAINRAICELKLERMKL